MVNDFEILKFMNVGVNSMTDINDNLRPPNTRISPAIVYDCSVLQLCGVSVQPAADVGSDQGQVQGHGYKV